MFSILNRLRGTDGLWARLIGAGIGFIFLMFTQDITASILLTVGYIAGESMGWGKWIGGILAGNKIATIEQLSDKEGRLNGIHFIADYFWDERYEYEDYCILALLIRGMYWSALTLLPLLGFGYIGFMSFALSTVFLGVMFPVSVYIGMYSSPIFSLNKYGFTMESSWEHAEVWYGLAMDIVLISLLLTTI